jgi:hypothetical protein
MRKLSKDELAFITPLDALETSDVRGAVVSYRKALESSKAPVN